MFITRFGLVARHDRRAYFTPGRDEQDAWSSKPDEILGATTSRAVSECSRRDVQECCTKLVATGRRFGSTCRKQPDAETKASLPRGHEVAQERGEEMGVESQNTLRGTVDRRCHPMA